MVIEFKKIIECKLEKFIDSINEFDSSYIILDDFDYDPMELPFSSKIYLLPIQCLKNNQIIFLKYLELTVSGL